MPPKDDKKKKDARKSAKKDKDPVNKSGGKAKKKKWFKGKVRDKLNKLVLFDKATYDKLCKEVPNYTLITSDCPTMPRWHAPEHGRDGTGRGCHSHHGAQHSVSCGKMSCPG